MSSILMFFRAIDSVDVYVEGIVFPDTFILNVCRNLANLQYLGAGENNLTSIPSEIGR